MELVCFVVAEAGPCCFWSRAGSKGLLAETEQASASSAAMSIELSDEEREFVIQALEHYHAYLHATDRKDGHARELMERLRGSTRKSVERSSNRKERQNKRA